MGAIASVQREVDMMKQNVKPTIKATVKVNLLTEKAVALFGTRLGTREKNQITFDIHSSLPKKHWTDTVLKEDLHYRIGTRLRTVPGLQKHNIGASPTAMHLNLTGASLEEGKDFTYEITQLTEYVYETDEAAGWDDIEPIK